MSDIEVQVTWFESVSYRSTVTIDEAQYHDWLGGEEAPEEHNSLRRFLEAGEESEWFEQTDTIKDFVDVDDRGIAHVERR